MIKTNIKNIQMAETLLKQADKLLSRKTLYGKNLQ